MSGGILLVVAGLWVGFQVLGGNALGRLGVIDSAPTSTSGTTVTTTGPGVQTGILIPQSNPPASITAPYKGLIPASQPPASIAAR